MRRLGRRLASASLVGVLFTFVPWAFSTYSSASAGDIRVVEVKIVAPVEYRLTNLWKLEMSKMLRDIGRRFKDRFGLAFRVKETGYWEPESRPKPLVDYIRELEEKVSRGESQLVIGIVSGLNFPGPPYGIADYLHSCVLIKDHPSISSLTSVLEHELCHIFGAIDLDEDGSIMSLNQRGARYDAFTSKIISLNRNRRFETQEFPLPPDVRDEALALYNGRLGREGEEARSREGEERELRIVLSHLYQEKSSSP
jgi:hypothetical protein